MLNRLVEREGAKLGHFVLSCCHLLWSQRDQLVLSTKHLIAPRALSNIAPPPPFFLLWGSKETLMALGGKIPLKERREGWLFLWGSWLAMCPGKNVRDVFELLMSSFFVCPIGLETGKRAADTLAFSMPICPFISLTPHFMVHWHCMSTESLLLMRPTAAKLYKSSTSFQQSLPNIMYVIEKEK